jgi:hypothetical protein
MFGKFIPIYAVESFVLFPFTGDYLNLEMFKIFYLLGVYQEINADSPKNSDRLHSG